MLFYTFCVDIQKYTRDNLVKILFNLIKSIDKYIDKYTLICYTNFDINDSIYEFSKFNIIFRDYYDKQEKKMYIDKWLNLSFNKINIYKDLYDEYKKNYIWIDLDTIICYNINYINDLSNVFIENGGDCINKNILFTNNNSIVVPRNRYIQGNFWKLDIELYYKLIETLDDLNKQNLKLRYDLQDLFTYYIYIKEHNNKNINVNILGNTIKNNTINGLCVWSTIGNTHTTESGLNNLYIENCTMKSKFYPNKEIHILSFTFNTYILFYNLIKKII